MSFYTHYVVCLVVTFLSVYEFAADDYNKRKYGVSGQIEKTITVDLNGAGGYKTVQSAIDSVPVSNQKWIHIFIKSGIYREKVTIPIEKGFIYLQGEGIEQTVIEYDDHQATDTSATFSAFANDITISGITFKNTYNIPNNKPAILPAVAAMLDGERYIVTDSSFDGLQDTLFDRTGRHYYKRCVISGGIDFIFGYAQSLFEGCTLNFTLGTYAPERPYGSITANQRLSPLHEGGFVFSNCTVMGVGKTLLGRAWGSHALVIFSQSQLSDVVLPIGWEAWYAKGHEGTLTIVEAGCTGAGANTSQRVPWLKKESLIDVARFTNVSFVDQDGWISRFPIKV